MRTPLSTEPATAPTTAPTIAPAAPRRTLPAGWAMTGLALTFSTLYLGAGVMTPLLVVDKERWHLAPSLLTLAFAVYAVGFLVAILTAGSLSDVVGRRPVLLVALMVQLASCVLFLLAPGIAWVVVGRIVQGAATGAASGALTAALVEVAPAHRRGLASALGSVSVTGGLALGSLLAGLAIQLTPSANTLVFAVLIVLTALSIVTIALSPETVPRTTGALRSLIPHVAVPTKARAQFIAAAPAVAAVWMLAGLSGGLAPSMVRAVFDLDSGLLNGVAGFVAPAASAFTGLCLTHADPRRAMSTGTWAAVLGAGVIIAGVYSENLAVMIIGQAVAGIGFGAVFTAALGLIVPRATIDQRAGVVAAIYVVSYGAFGTPIVAAGYLAAPLGEVPALYWYTALTILLAVGSLIAGSRVRE